METKGMSKANSKDLVTHGILEVSHNDYCVATNRTSPLEATRNVAGRLILSGRKILGEF